MASEWARGKVERIIKLAECIHEDDCEGPYGEEPCDCWVAEVRQEIAAALDAAREKGAQRERWECHRLARACERERLSQMRTMDDFGRRDCVEAKATEATRIADAISARGPMRWREEE